MRSLGNRHSLDLSRGVRSKSRLSLKEQEKSQGSLSHTQSPTERGKPFLDKQVGFSGNNLHPELRKLCLAVRAILERPELLLLHEEALDFGYGLEHNLTLLCELLDETTVLAITKSHQCLDRYQRLMLMDAGYVLSGGSLEEQLRSEDSYLCKYLEETDPRTLEVLLSKYGFAQAHKARRTMKRENRFTVFHQIPSPTMSPFETHTKLPSIQPSILEHKISSQMDKTLAEGELGGRKSPSIGPSRSAADWKEGWLKSGILSAVSKERSRSVAQFGTFGFGSGPHQNHTLEMHLEPTDHKKALSPESELEVALNLPDSAEIGTKLPSGSRRFLNSIDLVPTEVHNQESPVWEKFPALEVFGTSPKPHGELTKIQLTRKVPNSPGMVGQSPGVKKGRKRQYEEGIHPVRVSHLNQNDLSARRHLHKPDNQTDAREEPSGEKSPKKTRTVTVEEQVCVLTRRTVVIEEY